MFNYWYGWVVVVLLCIQENQEILKFETPYRTQNRGKLDRQNCPGYLKVGYDGYLDKIEAGSSVEIKLKNIIRANRNKIMAINFSPYYLWRTLYILRVY